MFNRLLIASVCIGLVACGGSNTSPSDSLAGNWSGTVTSNVVGTGNVALTLTHQGSKIGGTYATGFPSAVNNSAGSVSGTLNGSSVSITLTPGSPTACPYQVTATRNGADAISGTYATFNCTAAIGGSFSVARK